jgi:hypothetical protein
MLVVLGIGMVLTRHVGLFFSLGIFLAFAFQPSMGWRKGLVFILPVLLVFILWNFGLMAEGVAGRVETLKSPVSGGTWSRLQNIEYYLGAVSTWVFPNAIPKVVRIPAFIGLASLLVYFLRGQLSKSDQAKSLLIISASYYVLMHVSFLIDESSADRYLMPIYPLFLIAFVSLLEKTVIRRSHWMKYLVIIWLLYPLTRTVKNTFFWREKICNELQTKTSSPINENYDLKQDG